MRRIIPLFCLCLFAGCADIRLPWTKTEEPVDVTVAPGQEVMRPEARPGRAGGARTADSFDRVDPADRVAAEAPVAGAYLGETLASLGAPSETGFWLVTGLVRSPVQGRVETAAGRAVGVELRPSGGDSGAGSRISLSAMRSLDLPLTALASLRVYAAR